LRCAHLLAKLRQPFPVYRLLLASEMLCGAQGHLGLPHQTPTLIDYCLLGSNISKRSLNLTCKLFQGGLLSLQLL
jgi:phosphoketolase